MSKIVVASIVVAALAGAGCSSPASTPTSCMSLYPDAGAVPGLVCDISWSCSSDSQHYEIQCTQSGGNYDCTCLTDTTSAGGRTLRLNPFVCDANGALPVATSGCGWTIQ